MRAIICAIFLLLPFAALSDPLTIAAGSPGNAYDRWARGVQQTLQVERVESEVKNYAGSTEIASAICNGEAEIGIMQIDAFFDRVEKGCTLNLYSTRGYDAAVIFFSTSSDKTALVELEEGDTLVTLPVGSGSDLFLRTAQRIQAEHRERPWTRLPIQNMSADEAATQLSLGLIDAVVVVGTFGSPTMNAFEKPNILIGELWDKGIEKKKIAEGGVPLYEAEEMTASWNKKKVSFWGYKVANVIAGNKAEIQQDFPGKEPAIAAAIR